MKVMYMRTEMALVGELVFYFENTKMVQWVDTNGRNITLFLHVEFLTNGGIPNAALEVLLLPRQITTDEKEG